MVTIAVVDLAFCVAIASQRNNTSVQGEQSRSCRVEAAFVLHGTARYAKLISPAVARIAALLKRDYLKMARVRRAVAAFGVVL